MKKIKKILSLPLVLSLVLSLMLVPSFKVKATTATITGSQTARDTNSITVGWSSNVSLETNKYFWVGIGETEDAAKEDAQKSTRSTKQNSIKIDKLTNGNALISGTKYYVCIAIAELSVSNRSACEGSIIAITTPSTPKNIAQTSWTLGSDTLTLEWEQDGNADGYEVLYVDDDGNDVTKTVTEKKVELDTTHTNYFNVRIRAFANYQPTGSTATNIYSAYSASFKAFAQPDIKETDDGYAVSVNSKKQLVVEFWKAKYAQGYEVWVATKKNGKYSKVKSTTNASATKLVAKKYKGKKFKKNGKYWVTVVATRKDANNNVNRTSSNYVVYYDKGETFLTIKKKSDITK